MNEEQLERLKALLEEVRKGLPLDGKFRLFVVGTAAELEATISLNTLMSCGDWSHVFSEALPLNAVAG